MEKKNEKKVLAKEALKAITELEEETRMENIVKDNKIEFKVKEKVYRVRKPNLTEQQEIDTARRKKYMKLVNDDSFLFRKQWVKIYKKKGVDVDEMDNKIRQKKNEIETLLLRLAKIDNAKEIDRIKKEYYKLRDEMFEISIEKTDLLTYSIEDQLLIYVNSYTTYIVLERKDGDKWLRHFNSYEDFMKSKDVELIQKTFMLINHLVYEADYESQNSKKTK